MKDEKIFRQKMTRNEVFKLIGELCLYYDIELCEISIEGDDVVIAFRMK